MEDRTQADDVARIVRRLWNLLEIVAWTVALGVIVLTLAEEVLRPSRRR